MVDIVFKHALHRDLYALCVAKGDGEHVTRLEPQTVGQVAVDDGALLGVGDGLRAVRQADNGGDVRVVGGHCVQGKDSGPVFDLIRGRLRKNAGLCGGVAAAEILLQGGIHRGGEGHGNVVVGNAAKLVVGNGGDGVPYAKARNDQRRTAADAQQHHKQALFVSQDVADGDLVQEGHPAPDKPDPLQQDALARLGGLGAHQTGRKQLQLRVTGEPGGPHGANKRCGQGNRRHHGVKVVAQTAAELVEHGVALPDALWEDPCPQHKAEDGAQQGRRPGVGDIFPGDGPVGVAQGLEGADLSALLIHHARHGRDTNQGSHQEEKPLFPLEDPESRSPVFRV